MHKKITVIRIFVLRHDSGSANLFGHAKAPGCRRCVDRPSRRDAARGSGLEWLSAGAVTGCAEATPGIADRLRADRGSARPTGPPRWMRAGPGVSSGRRLRPSVRKATAGHQRPQPSGGFHPPACAGGRGLSDKRILREPRAAGRFGDLRSPDGVLRNPVGMLEGTSREPSGSLRSGRQLPLTLGSMRLGRQSA
jgi:hypothetical protein